jgi:seryl-tRNA synthetase
MLFLHGIADALGDASMIDLTLLRESPQQTLARIAKKDPHFNGEKLILLDKEVRRLRSVIEQLRHEKNELARQGQRGVTEELRQHARALTEQLKGYEAELVTAEKACMDLYLHCPNLPADDVPVGNKEANKVVKVQGEKPQFNFPVRNHVELGEALGWLDFHAAAAMTGSHFALYRNEAVTLLYRLSLFMLSTAIRYGFSPILPPFLINEAALVGASNFPRFKDQVYALEADGLYLTPTAEVNLTNLYRDHIFMADTLPVRLTALTSCFRREAGGYGATERGLIRIHQFEKVELYTLCLPEQAPVEQDRMLACAEEILDTLGLHYRISLLAGQDCSFASAKTYDIEVWLPGQQEYKEISSISNCTDFQARRCAIRYRHHAGDKTQLVYTLNGSSLALPRLMVALMETYQQQDGSINLPAFSYTL